MGGKNKLPYYKRYPRDFLEGTLGLSFELKAAYGLVLDLIYIHGTELPDDQRFIAGQLNVSVRKWNAIRTELLKADKIQIISGFISNYRAVIELESLSKYQDKQAENARESNKNNRLQKPPLEPKECQPEPEPEPLKRTTKVVHKKPPTKPDIVTLLSEVCSQAIAQDFIDHRAAMKKPVTKLAVRRIVNRLRGNMNADAVLNLSIENGWQGIFPEKVGANGYGNHNGNAPAGGNRPDAALENIARLARLR